MDGRVLIFTSVVAPFIGLLFGLAPVLHARGSLRQSGTWRYSRAVAAPRRAGRLGKFAIALVLLTGAGLMAKSLWTLLQVPPGFHPEIADRTTFPAASIYQRL